MTRKIYILFLFFPCINNAQEKDNFNGYLDTMVSEVKRVYSIEEDSITSLMIFTYIYGDGYGHGKGFLVHNNIPSPRTDTSLPIPLCSDSCNIRLVAYPYSDSLYIIEYKWRNETKSVIDTCYLFRHYNSYMAFSKNIYSKEVVYETRISWYTGPTSNHQGEVIRNCKGVGRETVFFKL